MLYKKIFFVTSRDLIVQFLCAILMRRSVPVIVIKQRKGHNVAIKKVVCYWSFLFSFLRRKVDSEEKGNEFRDR